MRGVLLSHHTKHTHPFLDVVKHGVDFFHLDSGLEGLRSGGHGLHYFFMVRLALQGIHLDRGGGGASATPETHRLISVPGVQWHPVDLLGL